jgi:DNA polymerase-3 subunit epsilon
MSLLGLVVMAAVLALFRYGSRVINRDMGAVPEPVTAKKLASKEAARVKGKARREDKKAEVVYADLALTDGAFVVADIETTGLSKSDADIIEIAAALVGADGRVQAKFSTLIKTGYAVPSEITELTGITTRDLMLEGRPLDVALKGFIDFLGDRPVFFHNASFDKGFLLHALENLNAEKRALVGGANFAGQVHDTLRITRFAWPELTSHKLGVLAKKVAAPDANHRAMGDVQALLHVFAAAKRTIRSRQRSEAWAAQQLETFQAGSVAAA